METDVSLGVGVGRPIEHPVAASAVGHAQDYIVNGHNASKAEARSFWRPTSAGTSSMCSFATDHALNRQ
jgi:hypothetical protein